MVNIEDTIKQSDVDFKMWSEALSVIERGYIWCICTIILFKEDMILSKTFLENIVCSIGWRIWKNEKWESLSKL